MIKRFFSFINNLLIQMFLVTGGKGGSGSLDSTEVKEIYEGERRAKQTIICIIFEDTPLSAVTVTAVFIQ